MTNSDLASELYYLDGCGKKRDADIHEAMLDNPEATIAADHAAMKQAMEGGMSLKEAVALYASPETLNWLKDRISL
ncbi:MAG: hypothetical protein H8M99_01195 [Gloeobacteraceae cyanobacterium ES-bin-144]|nr:hypothetical protein [Verrucomicrobiales bacterium]